MNDNKIHSIDESKKTDFGFEFINIEEKTKKVKKIFNSVSYRYDIMNDIMSFGLHRIWKKLLVNNANIRNNMKLLDIAAGTGDLTKLVLEKSNFNDGEIWLSDINKNMLNIGISRLLDYGFKIPAVVCDAENLPFKSLYFDRVILSFGLRNMTNKDLALKEMFRVLKPGGRLLILEFSKVNSLFISKLYDLYSFCMIPWIGKKITGDELSYKYLVESIRMHPSQKVIMQMMKSAGFDIVRYKNFSSGIVALHEGIKI
ncbi:Ubiquinone/menaquinone biosynthesis C-methyltransferase UbiE [Candidatus Kinetoplastibacterium sorsogonicusi]|uniref:Ubiquinone/menaquinone biosynthesis C-methyltransferase UbiE n=1 Tax=Candidatus Kinetoplastidibacterium kentomonadis TaxID=1576550 RepID=A0A3S7J951_9PROT|nr:class I SAM-dependent methyltransferase [Candidatus Kinetoplastibacterium sorsogonicusi]AWD32204.1 Ubiquinone/menaquinone biosynthesis C-methyltransferase UbiE [Candidatus Kinetoplastibacterium sorsogonicusi]